MPVTAALNRLMYPSLHTNFYRDSESLNNMAPSKRFLLLKHIMINTVARRAHWMLLADNYLNSRNKDSLYMWRTKS